MDADRGDRLVDVVRDVALIVIVGLVALVMIDVVASSPEPVPGLRPAAYVHPEEVTP